MLTTKQDVPFCHLLFLFFFGCIFHFIDFDYAINERWYRNYYLNRSNRGDRFVLRTQKSCSFNRSKLIDNFEQNNRVQSIIWLFDRSDILILFFLVSDLFFNFIISWYTRNTCKSFSRFFVVAFFYIISSEDCDDLRAFNYGQMTCRLMVSSSRVHFMKNCLRCHNSYPLYDIYFFSVAVTDNKFKITIISCV